MTWWLEDRKGIVLRFPTDFSQIMTEPHPQVYRVELGNLHNALTSQHPEDFLVCQNQRRNIKKYIIERMSTKIKEVLELGLASILVRLTQAVNSLQPLPSDSTW